MSTKSIAGCNSTFRPRRARIDRRARIGDRFTLANRALVLQTASAPGRISQGGHHVVETDTPTTT